MIVVWTEGVGKKFRTAAEIATDAKRKQKKIDAKPGKYYLYIPKGVMVILPGNTIHAGGLCFGSKMEYPTAQKKIFFRTTGFTSFSVAVNKARGMLIMRRTQLSQITFASVWMILNQKKVS